MALCGASRNRAAKAQLRYSCDEWKKKLEQMPYLHETSKGRSVIGRTVAHFNAADGDELETGH